MPPPRKQVLHGRQASGPASVRVPSARAAPVKEQETQCQSAHTAEGPDTTALCLSDSEFSFQFCFWFVGGLCPRDLFLFSVQSGSW